MPGAKRLEFLARIRHPLGRVTDIRAVHSVTSSFREYQQIRADFESFISEPLAVTIFQLPFDSEPSAHIAFPHPRDLKYGRPCGMLSQPATEHYIDSRDGGPDRGRLNTCASRRTPWGSDAVPQCQQNSRQMDPDAKFLFHIDIT